MNSFTSPMTILIAEDSPDDRLLIEEAWQETALVNLHIVEDGEELMDFLYHHSDRDLPTSSLNPALILLDLNMPRKNGYEVLHELKTNPDLRKIPVVVLSTSASQLDVNRSYKLGASSYFTKPNTFEEFMALMKILYKYWFEVASLPS